MNTDKNEINMLARRAAVINLYATINPIKQFLATGNIAELYQAEEENEIRREQNGEKMYAYIKSFLQDFSRCNQQTQKGVLSQYGKYHEEEMATYINLISITTGKDLSLGCSFNQSIDNEGNIFVEVEDLFGEKKKVIVFP